MNKSYRCTTPASNRPFEAVTLGVLGIIYFDNRDLDKADEHFREALNIGQAIGDRRIEANTYNWLAQVAQARGRLDEARQYIETCLRIIESLRASFSGPQFRTAFFSGTQTYYQLCVDLIMRLHQQNTGEGLAAQALQVSERARARGLLETLYEARIDLRRDVDAALLERERKIQERLNSQAFRQRQLFLAKKTDEATAAAKEIEAITNELREAQAEIRKASPRYAALTQPRPLTIEEMQRELLDENTLLLEYSLGEQRSYLFALTSTSLTSYELPKRAEIEAQASRVYDLLTARNQSVNDETPRQEQERAARADAELRPQAAALSRMILGPAAAQLGRKRLLVVTQGRLQLIPFGALPEPESGRSGERENRDNPQSAIPLIVNHEIVSLPSASTLIVLRREMAGRKTAPKTVALLADPVFETDDKRFKSLRAQPAPKIPAAPRSRSRDLLRAAEAFGDAGDQVYFRRLENTGWEANQIAKLAPAAQALNAQGFAATRTIVISGELSKYRIIHFASHGFLHSAYPELSGIVLSLLNEHGQEQDGFLRLHEIYNLKLPADLVVLSACRTGLGKEIRGEGLMSLTRGFMYAGAPRVIVSAWEVQDRPSATLMVKFYRHLLGPKRLSPAAALRAAQLEMWRDKQFAAPYYWAGFTLQGEWK